MGESTSNSIEVAMARTSPKYGCAPGDRPLEEILHNGIIVLDKPRGPSSHEVVSWAKKILGIDKAGHSGTLDPKVTGVLPVALDNGTRIVKNLLDTGKEYICLMRLHDDVGQDAVRDVMCSFQGQIFQRPPVKSAVKRQVRKRRIYSLEILDVVDRFVLFRVECEAGTYIRKLVYDIGMALGCGANMAELRRTKAGSFTEGDLVTLQELSDAFHYYKEGDCAPLSRIIHPIERAVDHLPKVYLRDSAIDAICHGADVAAPGVAKLDGNVRKKRKVAIFSLKGELVALGQALVDAEDFKKMKSGFLINTQRVVMKENTYPKYWKSSS